MVDIVQLVERQIVDLVVAGSSPVIHPIQISHFKGVIFYLTLLMANGLEPRFALSPRPRRCAPEITLKQQAVVVS